MLKWVPRHRFTSNVGNHGSFHDSFKVAGSRNELIQSCGDTSGVELNHSLMLFICNQTHK